MKPSQNILCFSFNLFDFLHRAVPTNNTVNDNNSNNKEATPTTKQYQQQESNTNKTTPTAKQYQQQPDQSPVLSRAVAPPVVGLACQKWINFLL